MGMRFITIREDGNEIYNQTRGWDGRTWPKLCTAWKLLFCDKEHCNTCNTAFSLPICASLYLFHLPPLTITTTRHLNFIKCSSVSFLICRICRIGFLDRPDLSFCKIFMLIAGRHAISCMLELEVLFKRCDQLQIVRKRQTTDHAASNCNTLVDKAEVAYSYHAYCTVKRMETVHTSSGVQQPVLTVVAYCVGKDKHFQWGIFDFVSSWWRSRQYSSKTPQTFFKRPGQRFADVGKIGVECRRLRAHSQGYSKICWGAEINSTEHFPTCVGVSRGIFSRKATQRKAPNVRPVTSISSLTPEEHYPSWSVASVSFRIVR